MHAFDENPQLSKYAACKTLYLGEIQHFQRLADNPERETYQMMYSKIPLIFHETVPLKGPF